MKAAKMGAKPKQLVAHRRTIGNNTGSFLAILFFCFISFGGDKLPGAAHFESEAIAGIQFGGDLPEGTVLNASNFCRVATYLRKAA